MIIPFSFLNNGLWPKGVDGALHILNGQTVTIPAGQTKDYSSITIDVGGTLLIDGTLSGDPTFIASRGAIVINGLLTSTTEFSGFFSAANPLGDVFSYTIVPNLAGGHGTDGLGGASGGTGTNGIGGGGGGGLGDAGGGVAGGSNGGAGSSASGAGGSGNVTLGNGGNGGYGDSSGGGGPGGSGGGSGGGGGGSGTGGSQYGGGGGGGGGYKGLNASAVELYCKSTITGTGLIDIGGRAGGNGGNGGFGGGGFGNNQGGGGGGGGAGGSGGKLKVRYMTTFSVTYNVAGGAGGSLGTGGSGSGTAGGAGNAGSSDIASL